MPLDSILSAFLTLFLVVDPIGTLFIFIALTAGYSPALKRRIALRAILIAFLVLAVFMLFGEWFLSTIGIEIAAFRVAGGLMLFAIGFEMLFEKRQKRKSDSAHEASENHDDYTEEDAVALATFPLAIPLIAGPGAMTAAMLLGTDAANDALLTGLYFLVVIAVLSITLVFFLQANRIEKRIGKSASIVLTRVFGILLAALAIQYVFEGVRSSFGL